MTSLPCCIFRDDLFASHVKAMMKGEENVWEDFAGKKPDEWRDIVFPQLMADFNPSLR